MEGMISKLVMNARPRMGRFNKRAMPRPRRSWTVMAWENDQEGINPGPPKSRVREHFLIVFQADILGWRSDRQVVVLESQIERIRQGENDESHDEKQGRRGKHICFPSRRQFLRRNALSMSPPRTHVARAPQTISVIASRQERHARSAISRAPPVCSTSPSIAKNMAKGQSSQSLSVRPL